MGESHPGPKAERGTPGNGGIASRARSRGGTPGNGGLRPGPAAEQGTSRNGGIASRTQSRVGDPWEWGGVTSRAHSRAGDPREWGGRVQGPPHASPVGNRVPATPSPSRARGASLAGACWGTLGHTGVHWGLQARHESETGCLVVFGPGRNPSCRGGNRGPGESCLSRHDWAQAQGPEPGFLLPSCRAPPAHGCPPRHTHRVEALELRGGAQASGPARLSTLPLRPWPMAGRMRPPCAPRVPPEPSPPLVLSPGKSSVTLSTRKTSLPLQTTRVLAQTRPGDFVSPSIDHWARVGNLPSV